MTIITGPSDGQILNGLFRRCAGLKDVYTLRVYEFDTGINNFTVNQENGAGGDPFDSPNSRKFVHARNNDSETLSILVADKLGKKSTVVFDYFVFINNSISTSKLKCDANSHQIWDKNQGRNH